MDVERLFQTSSVAAVREVEAKTRHEIEEKKKQLRQVVGDSYRCAASERVAAARTAATATPRLS